MPWTQTDTSFKKLSSKRITTSTGKGLPEEKGASTLELYLPDIKTGTIPGTPPNATTDVLYYTGAIGQTLTVDTSVPGNLTWFATSGYGNTTNANDGSALSESQRLGNWVSDKYDGFGTVAGAGYEIKVYDKNDNLITKSDNSNWLFDYQTGILIFNNNVNSYGTGISVNGPYRIVGHRYIGPQGVIPASYGGLGYTSYTLGDLFVGAGSTIIKFPLGSNNQVLKIDSTSATGLTWGAAAASAITTLNGLTDSTQTFIAGTSGTLFNISSVGSSHTFNIPIAGAGSTGLISTDAQTIAGQKTFSSAIIGDLTGTATTAGFAFTTNYAHQSGYGITAGLATTATYAHQSGYAITSGFASTATYSYQSGYGITSGLATTANYSHQSGYAITSGSSDTAGFASTATYSYQSGYGITAGLAATATYAHQSGYAITSGSSGFASTAAYAYQSGYGITAGFATTAAYAHQSGYAITSGSSGFATTATYSHQSGYGLTSGLATTASYAHQSGYAITSGSSNSSAFASTAANLNVSSAVSGLFYPVLSNTASSTSGIGASVNSFFSFNATTGAFGATSINILSGQAYSIGGNSVLSATSLGTGVTNSSLTAVGTITTGVWAGTLITGLYGGTGYNSYTKGDILVGSGSTFIKVNVGTDNFVLVADSTTASGVKWNSIAGLSITSVNGLTASTQFFSTGTSGTGFNIASSGSTHTFNIPIAGTGATGLVSTLAQSFAGVKTFTNDVIISSTTGSTAFNTGALTVFGGLGVSGQLSFNQAALGYTGATNPSMAFIGSTTAAPITLTVLSDNSLLWEGTSGKLFGINNNLSSGWIFNVGDISGLPIIRANADGTIAMAEFTANVGIGLSNPSYKLHVVGDTNLSSSYVYRINGTSVLSATSLGTGVTNSSLTAVGTITTGVWAATAITSFYGGTGYSIYSTGDLLVGAGATLSKLSVGTNNFILVADSAAPGGIKWANVSGFAITNINGLTASKQDLAFGYSGTVPAFSSSGSTHTLNIPLAGTGSTGLVSTQAQSFAGIKTFTNAVSITDSTGSGSYTAGALVVTGGVGVGGTLNVQGDLNVQGTFTTINSTTITVADKNIELGVVSSPSDLTAQGGGITLRGGTDKSINWYSGVGWSSSESLNLASGNTYKINGGIVLSATSLGTGVTNSNLTAVGTITTGTWSATAITALYGGTGLIPSFTVGDILYANTSSTWGRLTANSNSGYVLTSAGSGATPTYVAPLTLSVGFASTSSYSHQSGYATTAGLATTASYSHQAGYAVTSGLATTATYAHQSGYAITSGSAATAATATYSYQSGFAITSGFATTATNLNVVSATTNTNHRVLFTPASGTASGAAVSIENTFVYNPSTDILSVSGLAVTGSTVSTGSTTGALVVTGGVGIGGTVYTATDLNVGNSAIGRLYFNQATLGSAGTTVIPSMAFIGTTNSPITLSVLADNSLSFDGSSGQLFSINNNLSSGWIFAVNDISGLPLLRANADGTVAMGEFAGNVGVGLSNPSYKLHVVGDTNLSSGYVYRINGTQVLSSTSLGTGVTNSSLTAVGTLSTGVWAATAITSFYGGTGYQTYTTGDLLVGAGSTLYKLPVGTNNFVLTADNTVPGGVKWSVAASTGVTTINALTSSIQYFATGTSGSGFNISSSGSTHTFNVPIAGTGTTGLVSTLAQSFAGVKTFTNDTIISSNTVSTSTSTGALTVTGGVGIGGSLYTGTSTADSISGVVLNNGVITTGSWSATAVTARYGGTGNTAYALGDLLVGAGSTFIKLPVGINSYVLGADSSKPAGIGWTTVTPLTVSDTPPASPKNADLWFNSFDGGLLVYYSDVDTNQWVEIALGSGIDLSQPVHITNATPSTSTSTGALIVDGGVGIQGELHTSSLVINGTYDVVGTSVTLSTTTADQAVYSLDASVYRSVKFMVQTTHGTDYQVQEILLLQDGVDTYLTQYAQLLSGNNLVLATYDADLNSGNMRLLVTPTYTNTTFKIYGTAVRL
jgi:hypothetical protein